MTLDVTLYLSALALYLLFFVWLGTRITDRLHPKGKKQGEPSWSMISQSLLAIGGAWYLVDILEDSHEWTLILNLRAEEPVAPQIVLSYLAVMAGIAFILLLASVVIGIWIAQLRFRRSEAHTQEPPQGLAYCLLATALAGGLIILSHPGYILLRDMILPSLQEYLVH